MKNIVYMSTSVTLLDDDQLIDILNSARKNNLKHNVTGVLLYSEGVFIQVLEGNEADVDVIFSKIQADARHKNIITLIDGLIEQRDFADWSMGFSTVHTDKVAGLVGYLKSTDKLSNRKQDSNVAIMTLKTFIETNKLLISY
jgi:hypothetical protein